MADPQQAEEHAENSDSASEFNDIVRGYDVTVKSSEGGEGFDVSVMDGSKLPWDIHFPPVNPEDFDGVDETPDGPDTVLNHASDPVLKHLAEAAVDLYEASNGTLGQGSGSGDEKKGSVQDMTPKSAISNISSPWEEWFSKMLGTQFEKPAYKLLEQLIETQLTPPNDPEYERLMEQERKISYDLDMLNLKRMQSDGKKQTTIIIQAQKTACGCCYWSFEDIEAFLGKFEGSALEAEALSKMQELLDLKKRFNDYEPPMSSYEQREEIEAQMNDLSLQLLQQHAMPAESGFDSGSNLAKDMMELVEKSELPADMPKRDVLSDPLPLSDLTSSPSSLQQMPQMPQLAAGVRYAFQEVEPVEDRVDELGNIRDDLDPACIDKEDFKFEVNDKITLSKELETPSGWGGVYESYPKGTKGVIENLYDKQGDYYIVRLEDNARVKLRWDQISSSGSKSSSTSQAERVPLVVKKVKRSV